MFDRTLLALAIVLVSCTPPPGEPGTDSGPGVTPGTDGSTPPPTDGSVVTPGEDGGTSITPATGAACTGWNSRTVLDTSGSWNEETCAEGAGCVRGECVVGQCTDECIPGEGSDGLDCELYDLGDDEWVDINPGSSMEDRARAFEAFIDERGSAPNGGIVNMRFTGDDMRNVDEWGALSDSSIWTGTWLAAEAWRYRATGSDEARERVRRIVGTLDLWGNVLGSRGLIARYVAPAGDSRLERYHDFSCTRKPEHHCDVEYEGERYDVIADPSRDQYVGPMLGYANAYQALTGYDEELRATIRNNVVAIVEEMIMRRTVRVSFVINGTSLGTHDVEARFLIPEPRLMIDGAIVATIDTGDLSDSGTIEGAQEFFPNPSAFFKQDALRSVPLLGLLVDRIPDEIPRSSSAMMVLSFVRIGMMVTDGVAGFEAQHAAFSDFYTSNADEYGNAADWARLSQSWQDDRDCGERYFGRNLMFTPYYSFQQLETDPSIRSAVVDGMMNAALWPDVAHHENSWFSFIYAASVGDMAIGTEAASQLSGHPSPVVRRSRTDLRGRYSGRQSGCDDLLDESQAVSVRDRIHRGFIWQEHPWALNERGRTGQTFPGVDYLVAYWLGRAEGFVEDDRPAHCARWR